MTDQLVSQHVTEAGHVPSMAMLEASYPMQAIIDKIAELKVSVLERAVLLNAEGWETGKLEFRYDDQPWDGSVKVTVWVNAWRRTDG